MSDGHKLSDGTFLTSVTGFGLSCFFAGTPQGSKSGRLRNEFQRGTVQLC